MHVNTTIAHIENKWKNFDRSSAGNCANGGFIDLAFGPRNSMARARARSLFAFKICICIREMVKVGEIKFFPLPRETERKNSARTGNKCIHFEASALYCIRRALVNRVTCTFIQRRNSKRWTRIRPRTIDLEILAGRRRANCQNGAIELRALLSPRRQMSKHATRNIAHRHIHILYIYLYEHIELMHFTSTHRNQLTSYDVRADRFLPVSSCSCCLQLPSDFGTFENDRKLLEKKKKKKTRSNGKKHRRSRNRPYIFYTRYKYIQNECPRIFIYVCGIHTYGIRSLNVCVRVLVICEVNAFGARDVRARRRPVVQWAGRGARSFAIGR